MKWKLIVPAVISAILLSAILSNSGSIPTGLRERVRVYTRNDEFNFIDWTLDALELKAAQLSTSQVNFLSQEAQHDLVTEYLQMVDRMNRLRYEISIIYANPATKDPETEAASQLAEQSALQAEMRLKAPLVETILQNQLTTVLSDMGFTLAGQPIPPVLYHVTELPMALIVSPRDTIRQDVNISLLAGLPLDEITRVEQAVEQNLNVSALVVPVGGVGTYPTMVQSTTDLNWTASTIAHEWIHNYLTLRPLGLNYETTPELRTMNETTASIAGDEIGAALIERYYPELVPQPVEQSPSASDGSQSEPQAPVFDYRAEMHTTRVTVDELLADGKIEEAEQYMEQRRQVFWENGYLIRRINQAYFAFYGAYADSPGGAAGEDPVGPAVRKLREQSADLAAFVNRISTMTSFDQLLQATQAQ